MSRPAPTHPEVHLVVSGRPRNASLLERVEWPTDDPPIDELVARASEHPEAWGWTLAGGEPTLRADLPELLSALSDLPRLGMATDGLALVRPESVRKLADAGLTRVRIGLHSGRPDAHDWLVGVPGAARRVRKAIEVCASAGLVVEVDTVVTRPVMPVLEEVVLLASALGARGIHFRRPWLDGPSWQASVSTSPRFGLLQPWLEGAAQTAKRRGLQVSLHGFPHCAAPSSGRFQAPRGTEQWLLPAGWSAEGLDPETGEGCEGCPAHCDGAPLDYVARFGRTELDSTGSSGEPSDVDEGGGVHVPAGRAGWRPATRVASARQRARRGRPVEDPGERVECLTVELKSGVSTREARLMLVRAAQERPDRLRLCGAWTTHEKAAGLLAETRYFDPDVEVVGEIDGLARLSDRALGKLGRVVRVVGLLRASDSSAHDRIVGRTGAHAATLDLVERLGSLGIDASVVVEEDLSEEVPS